jgi:nucleotide-binding universal stress UspA family protein
MSTIVVGVDGSEGALEALRFAIEEARARGASMAAINAWHVPPMAYGAGFVPTTVDFEGYRTIAHSALERSLEEVDAAGSGISVTTHVSEGQPAEVLLEAARDAALLVVGSRGLGGFRGLLLGSVSQQCVHHAPCPVVVVPGKPGS